MKIKDTYHTLTPAKYLLGHLGAAPKCQCSVLQNKVTPMTQMCHSLNVSCIMQELSGGYRAPLIYPILLTDKRYPRTN